MQLRRTALLAGVCGVTLMASSQAHAQVGIDVAGSIFHEQGGPLHMTVLMPSAAASVGIGDFAAVRASWTADIVSGASVAVVDAPASDVDAITSATLDDMRHAFRGQLVLKDDTAQLGVGYTYAFESDYRSHAVDVRAKTELFDRNTGFELSYARAFDEVCDVPGTFDAVMKPRLDASDGCFEDADKRTERDLALHTLQASWTQAWTPILSTQLGTSAQLLHGFQSNAYRAVRIGKTAAQEHHPVDRARYAASLGARLWVAPLSGAIQLIFRAYRDTWSITSWTGEGAYEQSLGGHVRVRLRGRYYAQGGAAFYSDDYVLQPKGQYFTGDRELSPMSSVLAGIQVTFSAPTDNDGEVLGFLSGLGLTIKGDALKTFFDEFHYDQAEVPNDLALLGSMELRAVF
jgi:Protein of unknown function (DUF3570)